VLCQRLTTTFPNFESDFVEIYWPPKKIVVGQIRKMVRMNEGKSRQEIVKGTTIPLERGNMPKGLAGMEEEGLLV
jgi:hypothetical protein